MTVQIIYDDCAALPTPLRSLVGADRYGDVVFRHQRMAELTDALASSVGWPKPIRLLTEDDVQSLMERLAEPNAPDTFLYWPSNFFPADDFDKLAVFARQITYAPNNLHVDCDAAASHVGWMVLSRPLTSRVLAAWHDDKINEFLSDAQNELVRLNGRIRLLDLSNVGTMQEVLSGQFDTRHFNSVQRQDYIVVKRSRDRAKMRSEYELYAHVPPEFQMFLVQPFDFRDDGQTASYRMERVALPDMALQWVNGAFTKPEFEAFLRHFFYFVSVRPARACTSTEAAAEQQHLYVDKVVSRTQDLKAMPEYGELGPLMQLAFGGLDSLVARYLDLLQRMKGKRASKRLVIGHGDPCFSNILYSKTGQSLKLIDPRGVPPNGDPYTDEYYDIAKLSHSVCGRYDFLNQEKFTIVLGDDLIPKLALDTHYPDWATELFEQIISEAGYDLDLARTYECSLFISMLPLHIDKPKKVLAFALNAAELLDTLEKGARA